MSEQQDGASDEFLLKLIGQGDRDAFSIIMKRYLNPVILFVMRFFPQRSEAEDIAQETFIRLWTKAPVWQDKGVSVKAWLFKVAYNQCIDQMRKHKLEFSSDGDEHIIDEKAFVERLIEVDADLTLQKIALDSLPERQCTAIILCAVKGLSNIEAAAVMGISVDALESLLARGRRKLKKMYQRELEKQHYVEKKIINDFY